MKTALIQQPTDCNERRMINGQSRKPIADDDDEWVAWLSATCNKKTRKVKDYFQRPIGKCGELHKLKEDDYLNLDNESKHFGFIIR